VTHSDWPHVLKHQKTLANNSVLLSKSKEGLSFSCCSLISNDEALRSNCVNNFLPNGKEIEQSSIKNQKTGCGAHIIPQSQEMLLSTGVEMLIAGLVSLSVSGFLYVGACELFCLAPHPRYADLRNASGENGDEDEENDEDDEDDEDNYKGKVLIRPYREF
jgi:hypothetical protein